MRVTGSGCGIHPFFSSHIEMGCWIEDTGSSKRSSHEIMSQSATCSINSSTSASLFWAASLEVIKGDDVDILVMV
jgi:hypothetical protein